GAALIRSSVISGQPGPLGADSSPVVMNAARILFDGGPVMFTRDLLVKSSIAHLSSIEMPVTHGAQAEISGNIQLDGPLKVSGPTLTLSGTISGSGALLASGIILSGNNTFTGGVEQNGSLVIGTDSAVGTGTLWINSGQPIS